MKLIKEKRLSLRVADRCDDKWFFQVQEKEGFITLTTCSKTKEFFGLEFEINTRIKKRDYEEAIEKLKSQGNCMILEKGGYIKMELDPLTKEISVIHKGPNKEPKEYSIDPKRRNSIDEIFFPTREIKTIYWDRELTGIYNEENYFKIEEDGREKDGRWDEIELSSQIRVGSSNNEFLVTMYPMYPNQVTEEDTKHCTHLKEFLFVKKPIYKAAIKKLKEKGNCRLSGKNGIEEYIDLTLKSQGLLVNHRGNFEYLINCGEEGCNKKCLIDELEMR